MKNLDGETGGPKRFKGPIGQQLTFDHKTLKMANYPPVNIPLIEFSKSATKELSTDQKYILIAINAVILGKD